MGLTLQKFINLKYIKFLFSLWCVCSFVQYKVHVGSPINAFDSIPHCSARASKSKKQQRAGQKECLGGLHRKIRYQNCKIVDRTIPSTQNKEGRKKEETRSKV